MRKNPIEKVIIESIMPYIVVGIILLIILKSSKDLSKKILTSEPVKKLRRDIEVVKKADKGEVVQAVSKIYSFKENPYLATVAWTVTPFVGIFTLLVKEPVYNSPEYFKNKQWVTDYKIGKKSREQIIQEAKAMRYNISPELAKLINYVK